MKLIRVGDTFEIVRTRPKQAGTTPFPDGLNRTQLRLTDEIREALGVENPELEGVSKDIQLVSVVNSFEQKLEEKTGVFEFENTTGGNVPVQTISLKDLFSEPRTAIYINQIVHRFENNSAGNRNAEWNIIGVDEDGDEWTLSQNRDTVASGNKSVFTFSRLDNNRLDKLELAENSLTSPTRTLPSSSVFILWDSFPQINLVLGSTTNSNTRSRLFYSLLATDDYLFAGT